MPKVKERAFSSTWTQISPYWIAVACAEGSVLARELGKLGLKPMADASYLGIKTGEDWAKDWKKIEPAIGKMNGVKAAIIPTDIAPSGPEIAFHLKGSNEIGEIADNLWFAEYLTEDRLVCFMQRVVDRRGKNVGYEAFARIEMPDGKIVSGGAIMEASRALKVEYQVDRLLHRKAIQSFVESDLEGIIFVNFLTGFIQRPEVYLEGLSQAVEQYRLLPRTVALDVPVADPRDLPKLRTIAQYCHSRGYALSLDDIFTTDGLGATLAETRPAFVKLDAKLGRDMQDPKKQHTVLSIIRQAREAGAAVLAEGIEDEKLHKAYLAADVDMFQGYHFGTPQRLPPKKKAS